MRVTPKAIRNTQLLQEALELPQPARAALADSLIESLDEEVDENPEAAWAAETEDVIGVYALAHAKRRPGYRKSRRL